jgi:uncharacterized protein YgiM (DUF1202 family)
MKRLKLLLFAVLATAALTGAVMGTASAAGSIAYGAGTVSATLLNVRTGPGMDNPIIATIGENATAVILDQGEGEWFYINYNGTIGYARAEYFKNVLLAENFSSTGVLVGDDVFLRDTPSTSGKVLGDYKSGAKMPVIGINNGWYKVQYDGKEGYIRSDYLKITGGYSTAVSAKIAAPTKTGNELVDFALGFVGYKYVYGGASPSGFDCSGLTSYVYKHFGYSITRNASGQYRDNGVKVARADLVPGDLVFFSSSGGSVTHVGIYIGNNEFVHASGVRVGVVVSSLDSSYYTSGWVGAKRIISE